jgi:hypothetical protein
MIFPYWKKEIMSENLARSKGKHYNKNFADRRRR